MLIDSFWGALAVFPTLVLLFVGVVASMIVWHHSRTFSWASLVIALWLAFAGVVYVILTRAGFLQPFFSQVVFHGIPIAAPIIFFLSALFFALAFCAQAYHLVNPKSPLQLNKDYRTTEIHKLFDSATGAGLPKVKDGLFREVQALSRQDERRKRAERKKEAVEDKEAVAHLLQSERIAASTQRIEARRKKRPVSGRSTALYRTARANQRKMAHDARKGKKIATESQAGAQQAQLLKKNMASAVAAGEPRTRRLRRAHRLSAILAKRHCLVEERQFWLDVLHAPQGELPSKGQLQFLLRLASSQRSAILQADYEEYLLRDHREIPKVTRLLPIAKRLFEQGYSSQKGKAQLIPLERSGRSSINTPLRGDSILP